MWDVSSSTILLTNLKRSRTTGLTFSNDSKKSKTCLVGCGENVRRFFLFCLVCVCVCLCSHCLLPPTKRRNWFDKNIDKDVVVIIVVATTTASVTSTTANSTFTTNPTVFSMPCIVLEGSTQPDWCRLC